MRYVDLSGIWSCTIEGQSGLMQVPGTLDESGIGVPDRGANQWHPDAQDNAALTGTVVIATRLTRVGTWEGPAEITRELHWTVPEGRRVFLEVERARCLRLLVNGREVPHAVPPTISTPHVFEVTSLMTGCDTLTIISDNSYPGLPHDAIVYSSAATDETQTNWNGLLGYVRLRVERAAFISDVRVYPHGDRLDVAVEVDGAGWQGMLKVSSAALAGETEMLSCEGEGRFRDLLLVSGVTRWDEEEGALYPLTVRGEGLDPVTVTFGVRDFASRAGRLTLNGRNIFLRSEANCAVFPETGHPPMEVDAWTEILGVYRSYGVNCMRFHSHMPPEAAFIAADKMGMLMQPELSHWNPRTAFEDDASWAYYREELRQCLLHLANHPSFVMLTLGNELACGELGHARMDELLAMAHEIDRTRLYANASNAHYGERGCDASSDFYASQSYYDRMIRATCSGMGGYLNHRYPGADADFSEGLAAIRTTYDKPVFTFEVGQYEVLPDFDELDDFRGVTRPDNLSLIRRRVCEGGFADEWKARVAATGELSNLCYREEIEAALRTEGLSGISLLGLQDFPGQGTALVGMLNSHLTPKPFDFARPERFRRFFRAELPLVLLPRYTWEAGQKLTAQVRFANYGRSNRTTAAKCTLTGDQLRLTCLLPERTARAGGLTDLGTLSLDLTGIERAEKLTLRVTYDGCENEYPVWVYPPVNPVCQDNVHEARYLDDAARAVLAAGGTVYLSPDAEEASLPGSIRTQFSTDFWSVGTFSSQTGAMGQMIDSAHPVFARFPTDSHTDWQWWPMATQRALVLPHPMQAIVTALDCYAYLRPMAQLLAFRCGGGQVLLSSMGLHRLQQYPEARALQDGIYRYLGSGACVPDQELTMEELAAMVASR